eukprot:3459087-Pleurochrysis_carterae.AAC.1
MGGTEREVGRTSRLAGLRHTTTWKDKMMENAHLDTRQDESQSRKDAKARKEDTFVVRIEKTGHFCGAY